MKRYEGAALGPKLQELIALKQDKQPYIRFFEKAKNCIHEGVEIDPQHCQINNDGKEIQVGIRGIYGVQTTVTAYYWTAGKANDGNQEITWLEV